MIRQYKLELEQAGVYIDSITGRYGGYRLERPEERKNLSSIIEETGEKFREIRKAIQNKNKVEIEFYSINSGITTRVIHPAQLFRYLDFWYVAAFCEKRQEIRMFKIEDIKKYKVLDEKYVEKNPIIF